MMRAAVALSLYALWALTTCTAWCDDVDAPFRTVAGIGELGWTYVAEGARCGHGLAVAVQALSGIASWTLACILIGLRG